MGDWVYPNVAEGFQVAGCKYGPHIVEPPNVHLLPISFAPPLFSVRAPQSGSLGYDWGSTLLWPFGLIHFSPPGAPASRNLRGVLISIPPPHSCRRGSSDFGTP